MIFVRRKLPTRVPDLLAVVGALLLIASSLAGTGDSIFATKSSSDRYATTVQDPMEVPQNAFSNPQTRMRKGFKISLMFFH
jgi:hypothetical protein